MSDRNKLAPGRRPPPKLGRGWVQPQQDQTEIKAPKETKPPQTEDDTSSPESMTPSTDLSRSNPQTSTAMAIFSQVDLQLPKNLGEDDRSLPSKLILHLSMKKQKSVTFDLLKQPRPEFYCFHCTPEDQPVFKIVSGKEDQYIKKSVPMTKLTSLSSRFSVKIHKPEDLKKLGLPDETKIVITLTCKKDVDIRDVVAYVENSVRMDIYMSGWSTEA
eukprot:TRINITY_DN15182_c0_g2_i3.p1 TRINITY_DN15182_c0_g2~~TRINITY_DN15182_c0_g2_i3.p1  ORF type:complete len:216 (+),score=39.61 TRINITY_DN15182_c0_g2_i3:59-706(+)